MQRAPIARMLLPQVLTQSGDFEALSPEQRAALVGRLAKANELIDDSLRAAEESGNSLREALLNLELDAMAILSISDPPAKTVSAWQVHASWTFECSHCRLANYVDRTAFIAMAALTVVVDVPRDQLSSWLRIWSAALKATFDRLSNATAFCDAIAQLIAMDMLAASLLTNVARLHVGGVLNRP